MSKTKPEISSNEMRDGYEADLVYIKSIRLSEKMTKKLQHLPY